MNQRGNILVWAVVLLIAVAAVVFLTSGSLPSSFIPPIGPTPIQPKTQTQTFEKSFQIPPTVVQKSGVAKEFLTEPKQIKLEYVLKGEKGTIEMTVFQGLDKYLSEKPRSIQYYDVAPTTKDFILKDLDDSIQKKELLLLVKGIETITPDKDDQARIAISLIQQIPYDLRAVIANDLTGKYPYEVLYTSKGVCQEKAELLVFLLRELGFGVAIFDYPSAVHMSLGIKCPMEYSYQNSGYCFIESTIPSIPTDSEGKYTGIGKLPAPKEIIPISDGLSMDSISQEFNDAKQYRKLLSNGPALDQKEYDEWLALSKKYGLETS